MPEHKPRTKAEKQVAVHEVMHEYKHGTLHSGSKHGPEVTSRAQAEAIAMSESGQSYGTGRHHDGKTQHGQHIAGGGESNDRNLHHIAGGEKDQGMHSKLRSQDNPNSDTKQSHGHATGEGERGGRDHHIAGGEPGHHEFGSGRAEHHPPTSGEPHRFNRPPATSAHGFGHAAHNRHGHLRMSGNSGAHRIGSRKK